MTPEQIAEHNTQQLTSCLNDIAESAVIMGKTPKGKIGMAIIWIKNWVQEEAKNRAIQHEDYT